MKENKTSISGAQSYEEIGEFWDSHDLGDYWDQTQPVEFEVEIPRKQPQPINDDSTDRRTPSTHSTKPVELFYSYSHKDEELRDQLEEHLAMLKREGVIKAWHDRRISGGREWAGKIDEHLNSADIILLLISSAFIASDYCYDIEVKRAMERHEAGAAFVVPIILRASDWHSAPFGKLQALPKDGKPVKQWPDQDVAFLDIVQGLRRVAEEISAKRSGGEDAHSEPTAADAHLLIPDLRVDFVRRRDSTDRDIVNLLRDELAPERPRLVALWGAGGVGKTAIAAEAVRGLIKPFAKRIAWISADGLESFSLTTLLDGIASQLGQPDLRKLSLELKKEQVRDLVKIAPTLVVLDNFETIEAGERTHCVEWLGNHAPCSALITTRDKIQEARNIPIDVMRSEEASELLDQLIAQAHDGRAFAKIDRDRLIQTAEANPLVLQWIVGQIDLAQDPDEVLDDLRHGEGTAAERVFNRSFDLKQLNNGGRAVLLALSLFAPSATRKAVAEVSGLGKESDKRKFKDAVKSLSALWLIHTTDESTRLAVEGLTRELTKTRLDTDPRGKTFRPRFVSRFLRYAETHAQTTREDYNALEFEKDNLLGAAELAFTQRDWGRVVRLAYALAVPTKGVLRVRGYWDEALRIAGQALTAARSAKSEEQVSKWSHNLAMMYEDRGKLEEAHRLYDESLKIKEKLGNELGIAYTLHQLAILAQHRGALAEARSLYDESLKVKKKLGDQRGIATGLHQLATLAQDQGEIAEAQQLYNESMSIKRKLGDEVGIASSLHQLAMLAQDQSRIEEARRLYHESFEIAKKLGNQEEIAASLHQLGELHLLEGAYDKAEEILQQSWAIVRKLGNKQYCAVCLESLGRVKLAQRQFPAAEALLLQSLRIAEPLGTPLTIGGIKHSLGLLAEKQDDKQRACQLLREALRIFEQLHSPKAERTRRDLERIEGNAS